MIKSELREIYLGKRKSISRDELAINSERIENLFFQSFDLGRVRCLHCFLPIEKFNEIDTRRIIERLWRDHPSIRTVVPRVDPEANELRSLDFAADTALARNAWGINEPTHDEYVESLIIDIVLVPGLCFDRRGHRVGYGKGYYDRFLRTCRADCVKIGLSYFEPVDKIDDAHEGDVAVDFVIVPSGVRTGSESDAGVA